jgi:hypothetical protein
MTLINKKAVRTIALELMKTRIPAHPDGRPKFVRVSKIFLDETEAEFRNLIAQKIKSHSTVGRVI